MGTDFFPSPASIAADLQRAQEERMRQHEWYTDHVRAGDTALAAADEALANLKEAQESGGKLPSPAAVELATALMHACAAIAQAHYAAPFGWAPLPETPEEGTTPS